MVTEVFPAAWVPSHPRRQWVRAAGMPWRPPPALLAAPGLGLRVLWRGHRGPVHPPPPSIHPPQSARGPVWLQVCSKAIVCPQVPRRRGPTLWPPGQAPSRGDATALQSRAGRRKQRRGAGLRETRARPAAQQAVLGGAGGGQGVGGGSRTSRDTTRQDQSLNGAEPLRRLTFGGPFRSSSCTS